MATKKPPSSSTSTLNEDLLFQVLDLEDEAFDREEKPSKDDEKKAIKPKPTRPPTFFSPRTMRQLSRLGREIRGNWFLVLFSISSPLAGAGGIIYADYQETCAKQIILAQHTHCVRSLGRLEVTDSSLALMGIGNPPPFKLDRIQESLSLCRGWQTELESIKPPGGWSKELVMEHIRARPHSPQRQAALHHPNGSKSGT